MRRVLVFVLISTFVANVTYADDATNFVATPQTEFQWWIDPQTNKMNFRRCDYAHSIWHCYGPMLLRGIDIKDVPAMLSFYRERLAESANHQLKQFVRLLSGSIGTIVAYAGTIGSLA